MSKLVLIRGISADKFEDGVSAPVLAIEGEETFAILQGLSDGYNIDEIKSGALEQLGSDESGLPPEFLWPMLFSNGVNKDSDDLKGTEVEVLHDFSAAA